jgi:hypothetical protein
MYYNVTVGTTADQGWTFGVRLPAEERDFSLLHSLKTGSGAHLASSSAEFNNNGAIPPLPDKSSWHGV